jgi:two-component system, chemotaxis family, protein-glutamate methylesterase/glutaminase
VSTPLRAILVEDSLVQRAHLAQVLQADGDIVVVAEASDARQAVRAIVEHEPDVVTMDLDLPGGGGRAVIEEIMATTPVPTLVLSGIIDDANAHPAIEALAAGAVEAMPKPLRWTAEEEHALREAVRRIAGVEVTGRLRAMAIARAAGEGPVIGIGASTGGPAALTALLRGLDGVEAPLLVVQHIHPAFVGGFVTWLGSAVPQRVRLAGQGVELERGTVYVAPGDAHLTLDAGRRIALSDEPEGPPRPSVDVLMHSLAEHAGPHGIGLLLTGVGHDGVAGLLALRAAGGATFGQDEASSTVFGMSRAAREAGATDVLLPPQRLSGAVLETIDGLRESA